MSLNTITLGGYVGSADLKQSANFNALKINLATTRNYTDKNGESITDWHEVRVINKNNYPVTLFGMIKKGDFITVMGSLYHDVNEKEDKKYHNYYVLAEQVHVISRKAQGQEQAQGNATSPTLSAMASQADQDNGNGEAPF